MGLLIFDFVFGFLCFVAWTGVLWLIGVPIEVAGTIGGIFGVLLFVVLIATQTGWEGNNEYGDD